TFLGYGAYGNAQRRCVIPGSVATRRPMSIATEVRRKSRTDIPATGQEPKHAKLLAWLDEVVELTQPDAIHYCDGSDAEWDQLVDHLVEKGTVVRLNDERKPNSIYTRTDPDDVARVED